MDFPLPCLIAGGYSAHQTAFRILRAKPCHFVGGYQTQATLQGSMFFFLVYNSCDGKQLAEKMLPLFLERVDFGKLNYYDEPNTCICEAVCVPLVL